MSVDVAPDVNAAAYPANFPVPAGMPIPTAEDIASASQPQGTGLAQAPAPPPATSTSWMTWALALATVGVVGYAGWYALRASPINALARRRAHRVVFDPTAPDASFAEAGWGDLRHASREGWTTPARALEEAAGIGPLVAAEPPHDAQPARARRSRSRSPR